MIRKNWQELAKNASWRSENWPVDPVDPCPLGYYLSLAILILVSSLITGGVDLNLSIIGPAPSAEY
jgi:hypothetical protein